MPSIVSLPDELLLHVITYIDDWRDICCLRGACGLFFRLLRDPAHLRDRICPLFVPRDASWRALNDRGEMERAVLAACLYIRPGFHSKQTLRALRRYGPFCRFLGFENAAEALRRAAQRERLEYERQRALSAGRYRRASEISAAISAADTPEPAAVPEARMNPVAVNARRLSCLIDDFAEGQACRWRQRPAAFNIAFGVGDLTVGGHITVLADAHDGAGGSSFGH